MSLMKMRERQKESPAAKEFRKPPSRGRAGWFGIASVVLAAAAIAAYVLVNVWVAAALILGAAVSGALSWHHARAIR